MSDEQSAAMRNPASDEMLTALGRVSACAMWLQHGVRDVIVLLLGDESKSSTHFRYTLGGAMREMQRLAREHESEWSSTVASWVDSTGWDVVKQRNKIIHGVMQKDVRGREGIWGLSKNPDDDLVPNPVHESPAPQPAYRMTTPDKARRKGWEVRGTPESGGAELLERAASVGFDPFHIRFSDDWVLVDEPAPEPLIEMPRLFMIPAVIHVAGQLMLAAEELSRIVDQGAEVAS